MIKATNTTKVLRSEILNSTVFVEMTEKQQELAFHIVHHVNKYIGRDVSGEVIRLGVIPERNEMFFMIEGDLSEIPVISCDSHDRKLVLAIYPDIESVFGDVGMLVVAREFDELPPFEVIQNLTEHAWNPECTSENCKRKRAA